MVQTSRTYKLSVGTTAVQLCSSDPNRKALLVVNNGSGTVYILSAQNLSTSEGMPIYSKESYEDETSQCELWIIADSDDQDVRVMMVSD